MLVIYNCVTLLAEHASCILFNKILHVEDIS